MQFFHKSYGTLYEVIGCYQRCYDVIHTSNNGLTHSNCIVTFLQWKISAQDICKKLKIVPHRHDISRISDSTISTSHDIRYEIILPYNCPTIYMAKLNCLKY